MGMTEVHDVTTKIFSMATILFVIQRDTFRKFDTHWCECLGKLKFDIAHVRGSPGVNPGKLIEVIVSNKIIRHVDQYLSLWTSLRPQSAVRSVAQFSCRTINSVVHYVETVPLLTLRRSLKMLRIFNNCGFTPAASEDTVYSLHMDSP